MTDRLKKLLLTSRPISWVNTAYPFAAGYILVTRSFGWVGIIGTVFYLLPYNLLMYGVNDVYDYESDIVNPRKGGAEGAKLKKSSHGLILAAAYGLSLPFIVFLLCVSHRPLGIIVFALNIFLVLAYSLPKLRFKERPFIDSITSSSHFVGPLIYALTFTHYQSSYGLIVLSFFLWGMASHAFGAVQDITADKAGDIGSVATVIGAKATVRLSIVLYIISALILIPFGWIGWIAAVLELAYVANIWQFRSITERDAESANAGWKRFIKLNWPAGFVVTLILLHVFRAH